MPAVIAIGQFAALLRRIARHPLAPGAVLALLAGSVSLQALPRLPPLSWLLAGGLLASLLWRWPLARLPALFLLGACNSGLRAELALRERLPPVLEGVELELRGRILDLPDRRADATRFDLVLHSASRNGEALPLRGRVRLSWYGTPPRLRPCASWQLRVRLKRPRGLSNPGGFDSERQALQLGLVAVGYVREDGANRELAPAPGCVAARRERIADAIAAEFGDTPVAHLLRALAVGDQRGLDAAEWQVLRATGVGHLIAISGFHVGMLALAGAWCARRLWRCRPQLALRWPAAVLEAPLALGCATAYAALAGFGIATVRTLLMLAVVMLARTLRRELPLRQALALALAALLLADPLALLAAGFWLSFAGVALLVYSFGNRPGLAWWRELVPAQVAMSLGLLPLSLWFFGHSSLVGPLANLVAVPWISFVVVPLTLAGVLTAALLPAAGSLILDIAAFALEGQWRLLEWLSTWPLAQWYFAEATAAAYGLAGLGVLWLLLPRGVPLRGVAALLLLPLLWPPAARPVRGGFDLSVIDVGQGLAVLLRTERHALLYDTGSRFPSGFDQGESVVAPAVQALGVRRLDTLVISHADGDHAGGAAGVIRNLHPRRIFAGEPVPGLDTAQACESGLAWQWDGVDFRALHPPPAGGGRGNASSCVLLVQSGQARLLLSGDMVAADEARIAAAAGAQPLVVLVPHHGSRTSSSNALLDALPIQAALVSAAYRSRFGHPHAEVVARYRERAVPLWNTADSGCLRWRFTPAAPPEPIEFCRQRRRHYWSE
ncbi:DNA internalization-related competence protein ComEC/Rec2 [Tahibacter harae]|uniref:DNA internalization-related competence protein ComEC/Rec2 n=1 Tax=Tahibacter harae TaxID=2963937 RepID=A0ABT1QVA9_9GAMM|nr:DNA internalization-related competence protein ComEC/Rec2 [Tahibacter harae]MCQ4166213.1 DNA internalization-related competence protein ComEC/Rec2 [Tahibacter harae]